MNPNVIQFCCFALDGICEFANICIENGIDVRYDEEMRNVPKNSTKYAWEKCCEKCYERENAGLRQRGPINLYFNETNGGEKENIGSKRKRRGEKSERVCSVREEGKFTMVQKYRYWRNRYL